MDKEVEANTLTATNFHTFYEVRNAGPNYNASVNNVSY